MKIRAIISAVSLAACMQLSAELPELNAVPADSAAAEIEATRPAVEPVRDVYSDYVPTCLLSDEELRRRFAFASPSFSPVIASWGNGGVWVSGGVAEAYGMAAVESGSLNVGQQVGNVTFNAYAGAMKTAFFRGLSTQWVFGGSAHWQFAPRLGLTVFGSYATRGYMRGMPPGLAETLSVPKFGGYLTWDFSEHWGVDVGVSAQQNNLGNWEARPMVAPYYRLGDAKLQIDVGGIVYEMLRSRPSFHGNPTMGPPKLNIPIAPRD